MWQNSNFEDSKIQSVLVSFTVTTTAASSVALGASAYELVSNKQNFPTGKRILGGYVEMVSNADQITDLGIGYFNAGNNYVYINTKNAKVYNVKLRIFYADK